MKPGYNTIRRKNPEGYKGLLVYQRALELQTFTYQITENFPITERRRKEHMRDSSRSVKQNIVEGWKRETTQQYIDFLSFSFGSLAELKEDGEDCLRFNLLKDNVWQELKRKCGELDFLMTRLKAALERKISKEEVMSPYQRWLGRRMAEAKKREDDFDLEIQKELEKFKREKREKGE